MIKFKEFSLVLISLIVAFSISEYAARSFGFLGEFSKSGIFFPVGKGFSTDWMDDSFLPAINTYETLTTKDIKSLNEVKINGDLFLVNKPEGVKRVVFIGDSGVYGSGVARENTFFSIIRSEFKGQSYEFINVGIPGFGPFISFNLFKEQIIHLQPDSVVYGFFMANDIHDILAEASIEKWRHYLLEIKIFKPFKRLALYNLFNFSQARIRSLIDSNIRGENFSNNMVDTDENGITLNHNVCTGRYSSYKKNLPKPLVKGWDIFENGLVDFKEYLSSNDIKFTTLIFPTLTVIEDRFIYLEGYDHLSCLKKAGIKFNEKELDTSQPHNFILQICNRHKLNCIDPTEKIKQQLGTKFFLYLDDHPTPAGHRLLATQLLQNINHWLP